jgi:hypothetical protein
MPNSYDDMQRRCPRLGGQVPFSYCRSSEASGEPCPKVFDCWWERFDVVDFFRRRLPSDAFSKLQNVPLPDKVASLVDLVRQAKNRVQKKE